MPTYSRSRCLLLEDYSKSLHADIEAGVRRQPYSLDAVSGFRILTRRRDYFVAEHIERQIREERIVDPFGETTTTERTIYLTTTILVRTQPPHIIMLDPPSTSLKVVHILCGFVDFRVPVVTPDLDVRLWAKRIGESVFRMRCDDIRVRNIDWGDGFSGSISLRGEGDIFSKAEALTNGRMHSLATVAGIVRMQDVQTRIRIGRTGRVELAGGVDFECYGMLYELAQW